MHQSLTKNTSRLFRAAKNAIRTHGIKGLLIRLGQEFDYRQPLSIISKHWQSPRAYARWQEIHAPSSEDLAKMRQAQEDLKLRPLISIIMPTYNTPAVYLREAIESVLIQVYENWQLCISDDNSSDEQTRKIIEEFTLQDNRIDVVFRSENGHISAASNSALEIAEGEFIIPLDHDDVLSPDALFQFITELNLYPDADLLYSDEDQLDQNGTRLNPFFKPDWSPDTLLSRMYTGHASMYRKALLESIGGFRTGFEGAQDYDLVLRFTEFTQNIRHIPKVLYHWRIHQASTAAGHGAKTYASEAGLRAIQEALDRRGDIGKVRQLPRHPGRYEVRYELKEEVLISILIPSRDQSAMLDQCLTSIFERSSYRNFEIVQIDNGSKEKDTFDVFSKWREKEPERYRVLRHDIPFNFSAINNFGVLHSKGEYLLFLNNDIEILSEDWLEGLLGQAQRPSIGAVGGKLLYPDGTIQHAGIILGIGNQNTAGHSHKHFPGTTTGYFGNVNTITNFSAITAACLMCKRSYFEKVQGFDEQLAIAYNDVDLCLKFLSRGLNNIYLPHVQLYHHESKSRGYENSPGKVYRFEREGRILRSKWSELLDNDPCYSPNLTLNSGDFIIRS